MATLGEAISRARELLAAGRPDEATALYDQLLTALPGEPDIWHEAGIARWQQGRVEAAIACLQRAVQLAPVHAAFHGNLGVAFRSAQRLPEAVAALTQALTLGPATAELCNNLALALKDSRREVEALTRFDEALQLQPDFGTAHFNRANLLLQMGRFDEAVEGYGRALALDPNDVGALGKLGVAYYDQGRMIDAVECFDRVLALRPDYPEARQNRGLAWLVLGDYARGWTEFEWRTECDGYVRRTFAQPRWRGEPLAGRTLMAYSEQGLGDTLQFVRYLPLIERAGGRAVLDAQPALHPLLRTSGFGGYLVEQPSRAVFDVQCPLLSLAGYLLDGSGRPYAPAGPYLAADARLAASWRERLESMAGFKVGIAWAGNPDHTHDRFRSAKVDVFGPLARLDGVRLIGLQRGEARQQSASAASKLGVLDLGDEFDTVQGAFMDSAAVIASLDLVVTVDTALAHLAGGMGVPVWVALHASPDWRWQLSGDRTAWYPSMRLFRQQQLGAWSDVFEAMAAELAGGIALRAH